MHQFVSIFAPSRKYLFAVIALFVVISTRADWDCVYNNFQAGTDNKVKGPGKAYTVSQPEQGEWKFTADLRNHSANLSGNDINVYSASNVTFSDYSIASGHGGMNSSIIFRLEFSAPVSQISWDISQHFLHLSEKGKFTARYCGEDGKWHDAYKYQGPYQKDIDPEPVIIKFSKPIKTLYLGWFAEVPPGQTGFWNMNSLGTLRTTGETGTAGNDKAALKTAQREHVIPDSFFGANIHVARPLEVSLLNELHMSEVRVDFLYRTLVPEMGKYDFSNGNWVIESADCGLREKLNLDVVVTDGPDWARNANGTFPNDASLADFENFIYSIATKYKGKIKYWEAMNEPDMAVWKEQYVVLLKAFYRGIKRADPTNLVVLSGFAGDEAAQLESVYRHGAKGYFDILNSHSYTRPRLPDEGGFLDKIDALRQVMRKYKDEKPLWVTEVGWNGVPKASLEQYRSKYLSHRSYSSDEDVQTAGTAQAYLLAATDPWIKRVYIFHLVQPIASTAESSDADHYIGLVESTDNGEIRKRDSFYALKTVIEMISGSTFVKKLKMNGGTTALLFRRDGRSIIAIWSRDNNARLESQGKFTLQRVVNVTGVAETNESNTLNLSRKPIYLECSSEQENKLLEQLKMADLRGAAGFLLQWGNLSFDQQGKGNAVMVELENVSGKNAPLPLVTLSADNSCHFSPAELRDAKSYVPGEKRQYRVLLTNPGNGDEISFKAEARFQDNESTVKVGKDFRCLAIPSIADNASLADFTTGKSGGVIEFGRESRQREIPDWQGEKDCSVRCRLAWNSRGLFFVSKVSDNVHYQDAASDKLAELWRGDSIQLGFNLTGKAMASANVSRYGVDDAELGLAWNPATQQAEAYVYFNPNGKTGPVKLDNLSITRDEKEKCTVYAALIPWSLFGLKSSPATDMIAMNILVNDNDGSGRRGWLEWAPGIGLSKDPGQFPKIMLIKK